MGESKHIREIMERVVSESLASHVTALKDELVDKACEQLERMTPAEAAPAPPPGGAPIDLLNAAMNSILDATTQVDILGSLLEGTSKFAERAALFVIRAGVATGWRATGLEHNEGIKAVALDLNSGLAARAYHDRVPAAGSSAEFDAQFVSTYGAPAEGTNALVLPLSIRDKVAALVYVDAGVRPGGKLDPSAMEALVHCTGMWLEIMGARKSGAAPVEHEVEHRVHADAAPEPHPAPVMEPPPAEPAPPVHAVAAEPSPEPAFTPAAVAAMDPHLPTAADVGHPPEYVAAVDPHLPTAADVGHPPTGMSPEEEEVHKKARRFAKLLVDEIKLYNQMKVVEGRAHKDIYARLRDDIDKSRATYDKRYGSTSASSGNYFTQELIRILANDDPSLLGDGFSG
ncbi:MAG: hypothetical protein WCC59_06725 [Terriglobales bacterium]